MLATVARLVGWVFSSSSLSRNLPTGDAKRREKKLDLRHEGRDVVDQGKRNVGARGTTSEGQDNGEGQWLLTVKETKNGPKPKARLVACWYAQECGADFDETLPPVARYGTVRMLVSIAASKRMCPRQFDVRTAYLYGSHPEEVYVFRCEGFRVGADNLKLTLFARAVEFSENPEFHSLSKHIHVGHCFVRERCSDNVEHVEGAKPSYASSGQEPFRDDTFNERSEMILMAQG